MITNLNPYGQHAWHVVAYHYHLAEEARRCKRPDNHWHVVTFYLYLTLGFDAMGFTAIAIEASEKLISILETIDSIDVVMLKQLQLRLLTLIERGK